LQISCLLDELRSAVGEAAVKTEPADISPYLVDWRGRYRGTALCVVEPGTAEDVASVVRTVSVHGASIVPQGGNTGLVGGGTPGAEVDGRQEVVLSMRRLNRIRDVDPLDNVIVAEAGVILQHAQEAAAAAGRLLPISLAAEGSAQIGGIVSTNAGGINVLRFGCTRDLVLGLEIVMADGLIWNGLQKLRKNNTGYDLKQLFIGAEGTLGIVTAAALKLFPLPHSQTTAFIAVPSPDSAVRLLRHLQAELGDSITAFELVERACLDLVLATVSDARDPLAEASPWYVLAEVSSTMKGLVIDDLVEESLATAVELDLVRDAVLARSATQRAEFWRLREEITEAERRHGPSAKHDISIPVSCIPEFLARAYEAVKSRFPQAKPIAFGHVGDGNIHFNVLAPVDETDAIGLIVYDLASDLGGSISAEHGIGRSKIDLLPRYKDRISLALMQQLRLTLDPLQSLNPGKLLQVVR
jgi:FAD/FMN-containing dehydrogenase